MLELFWDLYQQRQIREARETAADAKSEAMAARMGALRELALAQERLDKLVLLTHAMWTLLSEKTGISQVDLIKRVTDLDGQDGTIDGRITRPPVRCSKCGATVCRKFNRCLFCGQTDTGDGAFGAL
ncbi:MAG TPA: hypothetical protein VHI98_02635 [Vicinamibacterales bacterium]|jgi:hypothetical protein|nr:hypothetical protein [Vicinamibacterales bacterium]